MSGKIGEESVEFPAFSLLIREFDAESGSNLTASSTFQSLDFRTSQRIARNPRVRANFDHTWTRRMPPAAQILKIGQNLSGRDFARSADHRHRFAAYPSSPVVQPDDARENRPAANCLCRARPLSF